MKEIFLDPAFGLLNAVATIFFAWCISVSIGWILVIHWKLKVKETDLKVSRAMWNSLPPKEQARLKERFSKHGVTDELD